MAVSLIFFATLSPPTIPSWIIPADFTGVLDRPLFGASLGIAAVRTAPRGALGAAELERLMELGGVEPDGGRRNSA